MSKRYKLSKSKSQRMFSKGASANHIKSINVNPIPMRGGYRI